MINFCTLSCTSGVYSHCFESVSKEMSGMEQEKLEEKENDEG